MRILVIILILGCVAVSCRAQQEDREIRAILVDKVWARSETSGNMSTGRYLFRAVKKKNDASQSGYKGGLIFHEGGKFTELLYGYEPGFTREPYAGKWKLKNGLITAKLDKKLTWYFKIIEITEKKLITLYRANDKP